MADQIVIQSAPPQEDPAHVAAMLAKVDERANTGAPEVPTVTPEVTPKTKPEGIPDKFWDAEKGEVRVEEMAKSYTELESKAGKPAVEPPKTPELNADGTPKVPELNADGTPKVPDAASELASKGLDLADFSAEFGKTGALAPESYDKLEKAGYPKAIVDQYIAGQQALAANYQNEVKSAAGGVEQFDEVATWAAENLTEAEKLAYNAAVDSGDVAKAKLAVAGITQRFQAVRPTEGKLLAGGNGPSSSGDAYESLAQMQADMAKPEYKADPAFRKKVADKIGRSNIL